MTVVRPRTSSISHRKWNRVPYTEKLTDWASFSEVANLQGWDVKSKTLGMHEDARLFVSRYTPKKEQSQTESLLVSCIIQLYSFTCCITQVFDLLGGHNWLPCPSLACFSSLARAENSWLRGFADLELGCVWLGAIFLQKLVYQCIRMFVCYRCQ